MSREKLQINIHSNEADPSYTDPEAIEQARAELKALDKEGKLFIAPNQTNKGDLEMWKIQLFEPHKDLDGKSAYDYFDKIIFGHGKGPSDIDQRTFKGADQLAEEFQVTIGEIKERVVKPGEKVLVVVCGTDKADKITLTGAIQEYLKNH